MTRPRILLADDDRRVLQVVGLTLPSEEFQVSYARDGREALRIAQEIRPALVLLDYQMPGLNGLELCRALRSDPMTEQAPIVMLTAHGTPAVREEARAAGVDDFVAKPFSPRLLRERVRSLLGRSTPAYSPTGSTARPERRSPLEAHPAAGWLSLSSESPVEDGETLRLRGMTRAQLLLLATDLTATMRDLRQAHARLSLSYTTTLEAFATALELRGAETEGHAQRVALYTVAAARRLGINGSDLEQVRWGATVHDVGMVGVPDAILLKHGPLLPDEWAQMRLHPELGTRLLQNIPDLTIALSVVRSHHERFDGHGYPDRLSGTAIPLPARVFAVADALDAITTHRSYRPARSWEEARQQIIAGRGSHFDPAVVDVFLELLDDFKDTPAT